jgi:hypothetical protein
MTNNLELTLPDFDLGTQAQIKAADNIRTEYILKLLDRGFEPVNIQLMLHVRTVAKWWLDNRDKLTVPNFTKQLSSAKSLVTRYGSIEQAGRSQIINAQKKIDDSALYQKLSQPMWKYSS